MANIVYENNTGKISVTKNTNDYGLFSGYNMNSADEQETIDNINDILENGADFNTYTDEILASKPKNVDAKNSTTSKMFEVIGSKSQIFGAEIVPQIASAQIKIDGVEYELFGSFKNNSDFKNVSLLGIVKTNEDGTKKNVKVVPYAKIKNGIAEIFTYVNDRADIGTKILNLFNKNPNLFKQVEDGGFVPNITFDNLLQQVKGYNEILDSLNPRIPNDANIHIAFTQFLEQNTKLNMCAIFLKDILNNKTEALNSALGLSNNGIELLSTSLKEYKVKIMSPDNENSAELLYSTLQNHNVNTSDFKGDYLQVNGFNNLDEAMNGAKNSAVVAFHFIKEIASLVKADYFKLVSLEIKKNQGIQLNNDELRQIEELKKAISDKITPLMENKFDNLHFYPKNREVQNLYNENPFDVIKYFVKKVKTAIAFENDQEAINKFTRDGTMLLGNANSKAIYYNGSVPFGYGVANISKEVNIKGSMSDDLTIVPKLTLDRFVIPSKKIVSLNDILATINNAQKADDIDMKELLKDIQKLSYKKYSSNTIESKILGDIINVLNSYNADTFTALKNYVNKGIIGNKDENLNNIKAFLEQSKVSFSEKRTPIKVFYAGSANSIDKQILDILMTIKNMHIDGKIKIDMNDNDENPKNLMNANIQKAIDFLNKNVSETINYVKYEKTRNLLLSISKILDINKNDIASLKDFVDKIETSKGKAIKIGKVAISAQNAEVLKLALADMKDHNHTEAIRESQIPFIRKDILATITNNGETTIKFEDKRDFIKKLAFNNEVSDILAINKVWQDIVKTVENNLQQGEVNPIYAVNELSKQDPMSSSLAITYKDKNTGEEKSFLNENKNIFKLNDKVANTDVVLSDIDEKGNVIRQKNIAIPLPSRVADTLNNILQQGQGGSGSNGIEISNNIIEQFKQEKKQEKDKILQSYNRTYTRPTLNPAVIQALQASQNIQPQQPKVEIVEASLIDNSLETAEPTAQPQSENNIEKGSNIFAQESHIVFDDEEFSIGNTIDDFGGFEIPSNMNDDEEIILDPDKKPNLNIDNEEDEDEDININNTNNLKLF